MKPKNVKVLQIWHACGAVKKFGNQIKRQYPVQNYDYVLCNAEYWKDPYSQAFNVEKDQPVFVYCDTGSTSILAARKMNSI